MYRFSDLGFGAKDAEGGPQPQMSKLGFGAACVMIVAGLSGGCAPNGPEVVPLSKARLAAAETKWETAGPKSYHLTVRFNTSRIEPMVYDVNVRDGVVSSFTRNGESATVTMADDYTMPGLFRLMHSELKLTELDANGHPSVPAELFVRFDDATGRLERYQRKTTRRVTGLRVEVADFKALTGSAEQQARTETR